MKTLLIVFTILQYSQHCLGHVEPVSLFKNTFPGQT